MIPEYSRDADTNECPKISVAFSRRDAGCDIAIISLNIQLIRVSDRRTRQQDGRLSIHTEVCTLLWDG